MAYTTNDATFSSCVNITQFFITRKRCIASNRESPPIKVIITTSSPTTPTPIIYGHRNRNRRVNLTILPQLHHHHHSRLQQYGLNPPPHKRNADATDTATTTVPAIAQQPQHRNRKATAPATLTPTQKHVNATAPPRLITIVHTISILITLLPSSYHLQTTTILSYSILSSSFTVNHLPHFRRPHPQHWYSYAIVIAIPLHH